MPAGHVDKGETLEAAAVREVQEETGYRVQLLEQLALYHESAHQSVKHVYRAEIVSGEERAQEGEILEVVWLSFDDIKRLNDTGELRAPWVFDVIETFESM